MNCAPRTQPTCQPTHTPPTQQRSYLRYREAVALLLRLAITSLPHCWPTLLLSLQVGDFFWRRAAAAGPGGPLLAFWVLLAHGSTALLECLLVLARPVRLALQAPLQLVQVRGAAPRCAAHELLRWQAAAQIPNRLSH